MAPDSTFGLTVQRMATADAILSLAQIASWRTDNRWFDTRDVRELFFALRVPLPANLSRDLGRLRDRRPALLLTSGTGTSLRWALTPEGENRAGQLIGDFDYPSIAVELHVLPGALFAHASYPTLPPVLAPPAWAPGVRGFIERYPFERNAFLMTRFPETTEEDPLGPVIKRLRATLSNEGLTLHLASDQQIVDDLWGNVGAHMWACRYGIGLLETTAPRPESEDGNPPDPKLVTLNDNVLIELGSMLTIGRRCMILRDRGAPMPPTDLTAQIFKETSFDDLDEVTTHAEGWVRKDLRLT